LWVLPRQTPDSNRKSIRSFSFDFIGFLFKTRKSILVAFSSDGLLWSDWQTVYHDNHSSVVYPTLMALEGDDNEVLGETFAVVYEYRGGNSSGAPFQFNYVNVTVTAAHAAAAGAAAADEKGPR
jgi:hypothetical protein